MYRAEVFQKSLYSIPRVHLGAFDELVETVVFCVLSKSPDSTLLESRITIRQSTLFFLSAQNFWGPKLTQFSQHLHYCSCKNYVWLSDISDGFSSDKEKQIRRRLHFTKPAWLKVPISSFMNFSSVSKQLYFELIYHSCITAHVSWFLL